MANNGHFKDTCPIICAAGVRNKPNFTVADTLKQYTLEDEVQALKADYHVNEKEFKPTKLTKSVAASRSPGIFVQSRELLRLPVQTRYQEMMKDLKESTYHSYWNRSIGKTADSTPAFPEGMKVDEITFGQPYKHDLTAKELVQPPKTPYQVLWDSQINHDVYKKIYNSYNPGERIDRGYNSAYNPNQTFGKYCGYDHRGLKGKCSLTWFETKKIGPANETQSNWVDRNRRFLGKCHEPNKSLQTVPKGYTFGVPYRREMYGMEDLLREPDTPVPPKVRNLRSWLKSLNRLKMLMEKKCNSNIGYDLLYQRMKFFDRDATGFVPFSILLEIMRCYEVLFNIPNVKALMEYLKVIVDDQVDYAKFLDAVKGKVPLGKVFDVPPDQLFYTSTYQAACCDNVIPDRNLELPVAGLPTHRNDEMKPASPYSDRYSHLSDVTDVRACLEPSIFTQYSLSHRDFFCPRDKKFIRTLFRNVGYHLTDGKFDNLWKAASERDKAGKVCVQTFREVLEDYYPLQKKLVVDEVPCY